MALKKELAAKTPPVRLVAIVGERLGYEEFVPKYWDSEIYLDERKQQIWPIMGGGNTRSMGLMSGLGSYVFGGGVAKSVAKHNARAAAAGRPLSEGNLVGEGKKLGGLWVIGPNGQGILFQHQEKSWGDIAEIDDVQRAVAKIIACSSAQALVKVPSIAAAVTSGTNTTSAADLGDSAAGL